MVFFSGFIFDPTIISLLSWWLLVPLSYAIQSQWLFIGIERNVEVALCIVSSRLVAVILVVNLVNKPSDYILGPAIIGIFFLAGSVMTMIFAFTTLRLRLRWIPIHDIVYILKKRKHNILGGASVILYRELNVVLLNLVTANESAVAIYSLAEKLVKGLQASVRPLNQLYFTKIVHSIQYTTSTDWSSFKTILKLTYPQMFAMLGISIIAIFGYLVLENKLSLLHDMPNHSEIAVLVLTMIPATFFGIANYTFGTIGLNYLSAQQYYFYSLLSVGALSLITCLLLGYFFAEFGAAITFVISEATLFTFITHKYLVNSTC